MADLAEENLAEVEFLAPFLIPVAVEAAAVAEAVAVAAAVAAAVVENKFVVIQKISRRKKDL